MSQNLISNDQIFASAQIVRQAASGLRNCWIEFLSSIGVDSFSLRIPPTQKYERLTRDVQECKNRTR